ncbi:hypothetical protein HZA98_00910 [Candidatus Woesearchaeota archaeon]|nr:hypothetical protein [Candidatus Woesearchaeota archaeon]
MKKMFGLGILCLLLFSALGAAEDIGADANVQAVVDADTTVTDAGTTPDSFLYGIDIALEKISLALTSNPQKKTAKGLAYAQERLLEIRAMFEAKDLAHAEKAVKAHGDLFSSLEDSIDSGSSNSSEELAYSVALEMALEKHKEKIKDIEDTLDFEDDSSASLAADLDGQTSAFDMKIKNHKEKAKAKVHQDGGDEDAEEEETSLALGLHDKEQKNAEKALEHAEEQLHGAQKKIDLETSKGSNTSEAVGFYTLANESYTQALEAFASGDFSLAEDLAEQAKELAISARQGKNFNDVEEGSDDKEDSSDENASEKGSVSVSASAKGKSESEEHGKGSSKGSSEDDSLDVNASVDVSLEASSGY